MANDQSKDSLPLSTETGQPQLRPKTRDANRVHIEYVRQLEEHKTKILNFPLTILVWGPNESSELYDTRIDILNALRATHNAIMSEDFTDLKSPLSIQHQGELQANGAHAVFILCCSPGSIAEAACFASKREIARKTVVFFDSAHDDGFFSDGPLRQLEANGGVVIKYTSPSDITSGQLWREVEEWIANLQDTAYKLANQKP